MAVDNKDFKEEFRKVIPLGMTIDDAIKALSDNRELKDYDHYVTSLLDNILDDYCQDYLMYPKRTTPFDREMRDAYKRVFNLLNEKYYFYEAISAFFDKKQKSVIENLNSYLERNYPKSGRNAIMEEDFALDFILIFKNAYPGFWNELSNILEKYNASERIVLLTKTLEDYYHRDNTPCNLDVMLNFMSKNQDMEIPKEIVAYTYYNQKMYGNALAYFEQTEQSGILFYLYDVYFWMAYCYGRRKDIKKEEEYYKKSIKLYPGHMGKNNLGYCLYKQKRYDEAKQLFIEILQEDPEMRYAANNYARCLIAQRGVQEAKELLKENKYKIAKDFREKLKKIALEDENYFSLIDTESKASNEDENGISAALSANRLEAKSIQFANEKILEDEITAKIESGIPMFGLRLKIWRRKGEYGRQYILPTGKRIDLLCEDDNGDIYIIELKKDSGYDDPYEQLTEYMNWFASSERFSDRKINGIICLNNPSDQLLKKVHSNANVKIYEYQLSYTEK